MGCSLADAGPERSTMVRIILLIACAAGGVWGAFRVLEILAEKAGGGPDLTFSPEAIPLLIPVGMVGAVVGAFVGGFIFPSPRR
jgi:hypothetical protein